MNFDTVYRKGVKRVWDEDADSQRKYISVIQEARQMSDMDFQTLNACFIPNNNYFVHFFGEESRSTQYGCYDERGLCFWNNCLVFPIVNAANQIVSLAGFNPLRYVEAKDTGDKSINYYVYNSKDVFEKGKYLFYIEGTYMDAVKNGFLFLTDGIFDTLSLASEGFSAAALMGSSLTQEILMQLRFIKRVILLVDNDPAGMKLYNSLCRYLNNVELAKQGITKDVDDLLKSSKHDWAVSWLEQIVSDKHRRGSVWCLGSA